jgi:tRNA 2-selenouridine synthase
LAQLARHTSPLVIDLEGLAHHRGSAFGAEDDPQPSQATFENALAAATVRPSNPGSIVVEDESRYVGARLMPEALWARMRTAPMVWLEAPLPVRVARVIAGYVHAPAERHGVATTHARLAANLLRIRRRLGGELLTALSADLDAARVDWFDPARHTGWVTTLLRDYYDRLYLHAFERSARTVAVRGDGLALLSFLQGAK